MTKSTVTIRKPRVYLAGKITDTDDWRHQIAPVIEPAPRNRSGDYEAWEDDALDPKHVVERPDFILTGPFFVDCGHGPTSSEEHAIGVGGTKEESRRQVHALSLRRIQMADVVFAHINEMDCFGTLVEIGYANAIGRPVFLHFGERMREAKMNELWFVQQTATKVTIHLSHTLERAFKQMLDICRSSALLTRKLLGK